MSQFSDDLIGDDKYLPNCEIGTRMLNSFLVGLNLVLPLVP